MNILIARHGEASFISEDGSDSNRILSDKGVEEVKKMAENILSEDVRFDLIISSNLKRAFQTALIISDTIFNGKENIITSNLLKPSSEPSKALRYILNFNKKNIIVVSHIPLVKEISFKLAGCEFNFSTASYIHLKSSGDMFEIISKYRV